MVYFIHGSIFDHWIHHCGYLWLYSNVQSCGNNRYYLSLFFFFFCCLHLYCCQLSFLLSLTLPISLFFFFFIFASKYQLCTFLAVGIVLSIDILNFALYTSDNTYNTMSAGHIFIAISFVSNDTYCYCHYYDNHYYSF